MGALLLLGTGYTRRIEKVVAERTSELASTNRRLHFEIEERQQAEAALRQAQRMEAIGQLTGGIAHDFNNLLTVISGNATLLDDNARDDTVRRRVAAIQRAAEKGERLTRQLLAFSRRQPLRPEPVDLRLRRHEITEIFSRSLRDDIELTVEIPEGVWPVMVDSSELDLALLNIGINARDAMPNGGRLRVEAEIFAFSPGIAVAGEALSGDFVALTLADTGAGMAVRYGHAHLSLFSRPRRSVRDPGLAFRRSTALQSRVAARHRSRATSARVPRLHFICRALRKHRLHPRPRQLRP